MAKRPEFNGRCSGCNRTRPNCMVVFLRVTGKATMYRPDPTTLCFDCRVAKYRGKYRLDNIHKWDPERYHQQRRKRMAKNKIKTRTKPLKEKGKATPPPPPATPPPFHDVCAIQRSDEAEGGTQTVETSKISSKNPVEVDAHDMDALMSAFEMLLGSQANVLSEWLANEYEMSEEDFDAALKRIGRACGRDFGIL